MPTKQQVLLARVASSAAGGREPARNFFIFRPGCVEILLIFSHLAFLKTDDLFWERREMAHLAYPEPRTLTQNLGST